MPAINVPFTDEEHQLLKITAATLGTTQQQLIRLSVDFTRLVAVEYLRNPDGSEFAISNLIHVIRGDGDAMHRAWSGLDAHLAYVRALERFVGDIAAGGTDHAPLARQVLDGEPLFRDRIDDLPRPRNDNSV